MTCSVKCNIAVTGDTQVRSTGAGWCLGWRKVSDSCWWHVLCGCLWQLWCHMLLCMTFVLWTVQQCWGMQQHFTHDQCSTSQILKQPWLFSWTWGRFLLMWRNGIICYCGCPGIFQGKWGETMTCDRISLRICKYKSVDFCSKLLFFQRQADKYCPLCYRCVCVCVV
jgi:hypothetical protein